MRDWKTFLFLEPNAERTPLYHQISLNLRTLIQKGALFPGEMLPSEEEMGACYGVSRLTMRRAVDDLVREKWLMRKHGVGTFVASPNVTPSIPRILSFSDKMKALGLRPSSRLIHQKTVPALEGAATALHLAVGTPLIEVARLRLVDEQPVMVETAYLPALLLPGLMDVDLGKASLYAVLRERYGLGIAWVDQTLEPGLMADDEAALLKTSVGAPGLISYVLAFTGDGNTIEYSRSITLAEKCKFMFHFRERTPQS